MEAGIEPALRRLRSPRTIRERCGLVYEAAQEGRLEHFILDPGRLDEAADAVIAATRAAYPSLDVPPHSRWRHFAAGGRDRWAELERRLSSRSRDEIARRRVELAVVSVLLDAGAGDAWRYREAATGQTLARSEGLAVASLRMFEAGAFSADPGDRLRVDGAALAAFDEAALGRGFQVSGDNPLVGLAGRVSLLRRLGSALAARPDIFGPGPARLGSLYDAFARSGDGGPVSAAAMLEILLDAFSEIWPGRLTLAGRNLGDVWRHPAARRDARDPTDGLVPFHKLSQWLAYSLIEPVEAAGLPVAGRDELTGLAEYRNGGLFLDLGVIVPRDRSSLARRHAVDSELVVAWRALTVILLDRLADRVRARLGLDSSAFPLASLLEGGSWAAGRRVAFARRATGAPPLSVESDGTVF